MADLKKLKRKDLEALRDKLRDRYADRKAENLDLDMTRGKPGADQLDLANGMLTCLGSDYKAADGIDCRNYGGVDGLPEAKKLFAAFLEVEPDEVIVGGNASLQIMHDVFVRAYTHGVPGGNGTWERAPAKFLCPSPGYDRHFKICQHFGIEMIPVAMRDDGPDMDAVEKLAAEDEAVKGIWCVPKYGNPTGVTYADAVVDRLAAMPVKAPDFRIFWDNAYTVHHLTDRPDRLKNILAACKAAGNPDRVYIFGSTSKVSFAGAGVAAMAASTHNVTELKAHLSIQTIGPDKLNQLRHVRFFKNMDGIRAHMKKHAALLRPKFDAVLGTLEAELGGKGIAVWSKPNGGYFVSLDTMDGCAKAIVAKAAEAGLKLTPSGATFPYGKDPCDRNIRLAPTLPPVKDVKRAMELVCICVQLVSVEKLLG
jgi:aspartate/methionine/tyrosine aminotransferase